jgi:hypothetical protein
MAFSGMLQARLDVFVQLSNDDLCHYPVRRPKCGRSCAMPPRRRVGPPPGLARALPHDSAISGSLPTCQSSGDITLYARHTKRQTVSRPEDPRCESLDDLRVRYSVADRSRPRSKKHSATGGFPADRLRHPGPQCQTGCRWSSSTIQRMRYVGVECGCIQRRPMFMSLMRIGCFPGRAVFSKPLSSRMERRSPGAQSCRPRAA